jgi:hypothetical protein
MDSALWLYPVKKSDSITGGTPRMQVQNHGTASPRFVRI